MTTATIAFDAIGGGKAGESDPGGDGSRRARTMAASSADTGRPLTSRYTSEGGLDRGPTEVTRSFGMAWGLGGWLLTPSSRRLAPEFVPGSPPSGGGRTHDDLRLQLHPRGLARRRGTAQIHRWLREQATGEKYLISPHKE